jgi:ATP-dependent DNA ligase
LGGRCCRIEPHARRAKPLERRKESVLGAAAHRVCEVKYDHMQGDRFRHATTFVRWRPDKRPQECRYDQLEVTKPHELQSIFSSGSSTV